MISQSADEVSEAMEDDPQFWAELYIQLQQECNRMENQLEQFKSILKTKETQIAELQLLHGGTKH